MCNYRIDYQDIINVDEKGIVFIICFVFFIDFKKIICCIFFYFVFIGCNSVEIFCVIQFFQIGDKYKVIIFINWVFGDDVIVYFSIKGDEVIKFFFNFCVVKFYFCFIFFFEID